MFTKTMFALCTSAVLATAFASAAKAQTNPQEWWRTAPLKAETGYVTPKNCIRGEESASSAYPAWMHC